MARRHRCDSAPIGLGHFPVGSNRSGLMWFWQRLDQALLLAGIADHRNGRSVSEAALTTRLNVARTVIGDSGEEQRLIKTLLEP